MPSFWRQAWASVITGATLGPNPDMNAKVIIVFVGALFVGTVLGVWYIDSKAAAALAGQ
jgi:hypothetical protein